MFLSVLSLGVALLLAGCAMKAPVEKPSAAAHVLDVFPTSAFEKSSGGRCTISSTYLPSGSLWAEGLDERQVFQVELKHEQDKDDSFALRVGKGGQIYSLRGVFGESVPPSYGSGHLDSPWNDEVWQFVTVCSKYNGLDSLLHAGKLPDDVAARLKDSPYRLTYFIHNSGVYFKGEQAVRSLYCPQLAESVAAGGRTYRTLNWGLVPQVRTVHRAPILYYTQVRDAGDGVIELTWVIHNFSTREDIVFDHLNAPWGGTRATSLPVHYVSSPANELLSRETVFAKNLDGAIDVRKTGGWSLACVTEADDSPALALVYGRDRHLEEEQKKSREGVEYCQYSASVIRNFRAHYPQLYESQWKDWRTRPPNSFRNYDVIEMIPRLRLKPGKSIWYRSFLVVNRKDRAIELAKKLVDQVDYGLIEFNPANTPRLPVFVRNGRVTATGRKPAFELFAHPVPGTQPLFLIENAETDREVITTDPYIFVAKEPLDFGIPKEHPASDYFRHAQGYSMDKHNSRWQRLLGYAYVTKPDAGNFVRLSERLDPAIFPKPDAYHFDLWVKSEKP
jgi:hypothetical protein